MAAACACQGTWGYVLAMRQRRGASECAQRVRWLPGVYDWFDIRACALAVIVAWAGDRVFGPLV